VGCVWEWIIQCEYGVVHARKWPSSEKWDVSEVGLDESYKINKI